MGETETSKTLGQLIGGALLGSIGGVTGSGLWGAFFGAVALVILITASEAWEAHRPRG